ncbi:hypothetical protein RRG08_047515 [Elysia crispata]|uniref:Uncharacterized protein n=1 Tax=Elysia crispata TaxID=231223 RepID=A0AAE0XXK0_9GAST|nr:hypothetical protein RRG08_047515 [Elysia crispata]
MPVEINNDVEIQFFRGFRAREIQQEIIQVNFIVHACTNQQNITVFVVHDALSQWQSELQRMRAVSVSTFAAYRSKIFPKTVLVKPIGKSKLGISSDLFSNSIGRARIVWIHSLIHKTFLPRFSCLHPADWSDMVMFPLYML